jgi:hypothetical protein
MNWLEKLFLEITMDMAAVPFMFNLDGQPVLIMDCRPEIVYHNHG